jgi:hypothetical protein
MAKSCLAHDRPSCRAPPIPSTTPHSRLGEAAREGRLRHVGVPLLGTLGRARLRRGRRGRRQLELARRDVSERFADGRSALEPSCVLALQGEERPGAHDGAQLASRDRPGTRTAQPSCSASDRAAGSSARVRERVRGIVVPRPLGLASLTAATTRTATRPSAPTRSHRPSGASRLRAVAWERFTYLGPGSSHQHRFEAGPGDGCTEMAGVGVGGDSGGSLYRWDELFCGVISGDGSFASGGSPDGTVWSQYHTAAVDAQDAIEFWSQYVLDVDGLPESPCPPVDNYNDPDGDGIPATCDSCPTIYNPEQLTEVHDEDLTAWGTPCDLCDWAVRPGRPARESQSRDRARGGLSQRGEGSGARPRRLRQRRSLPARRRRLSRGVLPRHVRCDAGPGRRAEVRRGAPAVASGRPAGSHLPALHSRAARATSTTWSSSMCSRARPSMTSSSRAARSTRPWGCVGATVSSTAKPIRRRWMGGPTADVASSLTVASTRTSMTRQGRPTAGSRVRTKDLNQPWSAAQVGTSGRSR